jgi:hypothetical protein
MNSSLNQKKTDMFPYELTEAEDSQLRQWVKDRMRIKETRLYRENLKRQAINLFRTKKNKLELKYGNLKLEHMKFVNKCINDQKKKGKVFKLRTRARTPWELDWELYIASHNNYGRK